MLKNIGAVAVGVLAGALVIFIVENVGHLIFPPPSGLNLKDPAVLATVMDQIPMGAKIVVIVGWFLGIFAGGAAALYIGKRWAPVAWVVAGTLFAMAAITMLQIPHPWWMVAGAIVATLAGGFSSVKLMRGSYARPASAPKTPTPGM
jgi:hypothetical protein